MKLESWRSLREHLERLLDMPLADRALALDRMQLTDEQREALATMLDSDASGDALEVAIGHEVSRLDREISGPPRIGETVGPYRLVRRLGEGGMGDVYLAERADGRYEAKVAVKFLALAGATASDMFERERRILARMQNPGIARMLDAGEDDQGNAFVVMEYVDGLRIDEYCDAKALPFSSRIELLASAADAVDHAHRMFVLHKDLKPAHLVVQGDGSVKILDFGVAGMLDPQTGESSPTISMSFTPRYAAPEQLLGEACSTGTDIYALALILCELLVGHHAFGAQDQPTSAINEAKLLGRRVPIKSLIELRSPLFRMRFGRPWMSDLNAIMERALAREPGARYASAAEFAAELRRLAQGRPVQTRRLSRWEQVWRWAQANRVSATSISVAIISLVLATVIALGFARQAVDQRNVALAEAEKAEAIADYMRSVFTSAAPWSNSGREVTAQDLLDSGVRGLEARGESLPAAIRGELWVLFGDMYRVVGNWDQALEMYSKAKRVSEDDSSTIHRKALIGEARTLATRGDYPAAISIYRQIDGATGAVRLNYESILARTNLAGLLESTGAVETAEDLIEPLHALQEEIARLPSGEWLLGNLKHTQSNIAGLGADGHRVRKALQTEYLGHYLRHWGTEMHPDVAAAMDALAFSHYALGERDLYAALEKRALEILTTIHGSNHPRVLIQKMNMALTTDDAERGLELAREVLSEIGADTRAPKYVWEGLAWFALGRTLEDTRDFAAAEAPLIRSVELVAERLGTKSYRHGQSLAALARVQWKMGDLSAAQRSFEMAVESLTAGVGREHPKTVQAEVDRFVFLVDSGRLEEAESVWPDLRMRAEGVQGTDSSILAQLLAISPFESSGRADAIERLGRSPKLSTMGYLHERAVELERRRSRS